MSWELLRGDCLSQMPTLEANSVHSVVVDPPYGLSKEPDIAEVMQCWMDGRPYRHGSNGLMGAEWDSFIPGPEYWKAAIRVLRPGGHALVFAGTRTVDLMGIALRFAGFEIRDCLSWAYLSGYSKGLNISAGIDAAKGLAEARGKLTTPTGGIHNASQHAIGFTGRQWADNPISPEAHAFRGWTSAIKPAHEPIIVARKPLDGTIVENVLKWGTGGINSLGCHVGQKHITPTGGILSRGGAGGVFSWSKDPVNTVHVGYLPPNLLLGHGYGCDNLVCEDACPVSAFKAQVGQTGGAEETAEAIPSFRWSEWDEPFLFVRKPTTDEREAGCEALPLVEAGTATGPGGMGIATNSRGEKIGRPMYHNHHLSLKPVALMRYLCRLVTPVGGTVLDPFCGSASTGIGALHERMNFVGIERDPKYCEIAEARLKYWDGRAADTAANRGGISEEW